MATKVAIQINCKIGGSPGSVPMPLGGLMVVGFDVCHDAKQKGKSYSAMVASLNKPMSRYFCAVSHHGTGEELSKPITNSLKQHNKPINNLMLLPPLRIMLPVIFPVTADGDSTPSTAKKSKLPTDSPWDKEDRHQPRHVGTRRPGMGRAGRLRVPHPGHATPGHATPGRETPSHDKGASSRRNRWDETPKTGRETPCQSGWAETPRTERSGAGDLIQETPTPGASKHRRLPQAR